MNSSEARWKNGTECNDLTLRYQKTHGLQAHLHNVRSIIQMLKTSDYAQAWKGCLREVSLLLGRNSDVFWLNLGELCLWIGANVMSIMFRGFC